MRKEKDSIGVVQVPSNSYYGAQTKRAFDNFQISPYTFPRVFIYSLGLIKFSAAKANFKLGELDVRLYNSILKSSEEVMDGKHDKEFILDVFQTGSGTSTNMNANEVIANRAIELMGGKLGTKIPVHPNDHVNKGQSSNDVIPTAINISSAILINNNLLVSLKRLKKYLNKKSKEFDKVIKIGRTHFQDATPITLGQEFSGYEFLIGKSIDSLNYSFKNLLLLAQGGTAVGTGINTHKDFAKILIDEIKKISNISFKETQNHFEAQSAQFAPLSISSDLKELAVSLSKISNDIRLMGSGPRAGFNELILPSIQPGSSIMPGKVNPVICESMLQVCGQVIGNDLAITYGAQGGVLELNLMLPLIAHNLLESITILDNSINNFVDRLIKGLKSNKEQCEKYVDRSLSLCTALVPVLGYDKSALVSKKAFNQNKSIKEVLIEDKILDESKIDELLNPVKMILPKE